MKFLHFVIIVTISSIFPYNMYSQNESDVLRFSETFVGGTARNMGVGGAFGALGADMSSLSINPAGIGAFRASEFTFTPGVLADKSQASLYAQSYTDNKYKFNLSNLGYVYTYNSNKDEGWVSVSFGIAYNRLNDFNRNVTISGNNPNSSLLDGFTSMLNSDYLNGNPLGTNANYDVIENDLEKYYYNYENLAYKTGTIYVDDPANPKVDGGFFTNDFQVAGGYGQLQQRIITTKGGIGEYAFSLGANYSHRLYLGMTVGIDRIAYEERKVHTERGIPGNYLSDFTFTDDFKTFGTGVNLKLGVIMRPVDMLRLGFAFHTPTFYGLSSEFYTRMDANYKQPPYENNNNTSFSQRSDLSTYDYEITTPLKAIGSAAIQFKQYGFISFDYEYVDYASGRIRADDDPFTDVNDIVQNSYKATSNMRIGGEAKLGDFALRAGYGFYGSPYKSGEFNKDASTTTYSAGIGFRGKGFYLDLGYVLMEKNYKHKMYDYEKYNTSTNTWDMIPEITDINNKFGRFVTTFGFRF